MNPQDVSTVPVHTRAVLADLVDDLVAEQMDPDVKERVHRWVQDPVHLQVRTLLRNEIRQQMQRQLAGQGSAVYLPPRQFGIKSK